MKMEKSVYIVEVCNRDDVVDVFGHEIEKNIRETGIKNIERVLTSVLYRFEGIEDKNQLIFIAEEILIDRVIHNYFLDDSNIKKRKEYRCVDVFYRRGVTDTVAETVITAVKDAGIKVTFSVATGQRYYLKGKLTDSDIETICMKVLVNPLIQEYYVRR